MNYSYKELQNALKNLRSDGFNVQVKLNAKQAVLQAEYDRLMTIPEPLQQLEPISADEFNAMMGLPTEALVIANATIEPVQPVETIEPAPLATSKPLKANLEPDQGYWIDGTELSEHLEATQTQAIRNIEDGWRSLRLLGKNLQAFKKGFDEGLRQAEAKKAALKLPKMSEKPKPPESAIKPSKIPKKAKRLSTAPRLPTAA
jgi:hypothetical protein